MAEPGAARGPLRTAGRALAILVAAGFVALLVYGVATKSPNTTIDDTLRQAKSARAPGFELDVLQRGALDGPLRPALARPLADGRLSLDELRGLPVVLNFWASWCIPCREEAPVLERSWRLQRGRGVLFLGLDMQDLTQDARDFLRRFAVAYPQIRDPSNPVARRWGVTGVPETFFVTPGARVVGHVIGVISDAQLRAGIAAARAGSVLGAREGGARRATR